MNREVGEHNGGTTVLGQSGEGGGASLGLVGGFFLRGKIQEKWMSGKINSL